MGFDIAPYGEAIARASQLLNTVLTRVLPAEKMSEKERAELSQAYAIELMKQDWTAVSKEFEDRADARSLAKSDIDKGNWLTGILAATVRPIWGYASLIVVAYPYLAGALDWPSVSIDDNTRTIVQTVIAFYFGGRTVEKVLALRSGK